jgi:hypothetical protein
VPAAKSPTKTSTRRLSDVARVAVPGDITSTGWPAVEAKCKEFGVSFRWWQKPIGQVILGKRANGKYATTIGGTGLSIPRQVGKTFLVGAIIFALCLLRPGLTVIWTAHRLRTAEETFGKMQKFTKRKRIAPFVSKVILGSGDEAIEFTNGSRILFGARERGFGRGFDEVDVVVYDEAQILTENALDDMIPATNQCRQPEGALLLFMGTPPKPTDPSEVWLRMRTEAMSGEDDDTAWIEFGADEDYEPTPAPAPLTEKDWKQIAKANPSFPEDTPREAILRMRKKLGHESFRREGMGIYDDLTKVKVDIFGAGKWAAGRTNAQPEAPAAIGVAVSVDRMWASIAAASVVEIEPPDDPEGEPVERIYVAAVDRRPGVAWLAAEVKRIQDEHDCIVVIDEKGPTRDLLDEFEDEDIAVEAYALDQYAEACSRIFDKVQVGHVLHPQPAEDEVDELDEAVAGAVWRTVGDRQVWGRRKSETDVSMLEAATLAAHAAQTVGAFNIY